MAQKKTSKKIVVAKVASKENTKKAVKKVAAKKVATKKVAKTTTCACKKKCTPEQAFWVNNGPVVKSVEDLVKAFKEMSDEQYAYHTKRDGNDFAKWVQDCLEDAVSAAALKKARTRVGAVRILSSGCACL